MAYSTPATWVAGAVLTAAQLNTQLRDNLNAAFPEASTGLSAVFATWTPVITQSGTPSKTTSYARYFKIGRLVHCWWAVSFTSAGTAANNIVLSGLPFTATLASAIQGSFKYFDSGATVHAGHAMGASTTSAVFNYDGFGNQMGNGDLAIASGDTFEGFILYEATT